MATCELPENKTTGGQCSMDGTVITPISANNIYLVYIRVTGVPRLFGCTFTGCAVTVGMWALVTSFSSIIQRKVAKKLVAKHLLVSAVLGAQPLVCIYTLYYSTNLWFTSRTNR